MGLPGSRLVKVSQRFEGPQGYAFASYASAQAFTVTVITALVDHITRLVKAPTVLRVGFSHKPQLDGILLEKLQLFLQADGQGGLNIGVKVPHIQGDQCAFRGFVGSSHCCSKGAQVVLFACETSTGQAAEQTQDASVGSKTVPEGCRV
jgi:hypothetical protein